MGLSLSLHVGLGVVGVVEYGGEVVGRLEEHLFVDLEEFPLRSDEEG